MTLERDDVVLFETDEYLFVEYPTLRTGDDVFDVFDEEDLLDEPVHLAGEELGTARELATTEGGDRVLLVEKPDTGPRAIWKAARDERTRDLGRALREECAPDVEPEPIDFPELDTVAGVPVITPGPSAERIVDEIDELLDELDPSRRDRQQLEYLRDAFERPDCWITVDADSDEAEQIRTGRVEDFSIAWGSGAVGDAVDDPPPARGATRCPHCDEWTDEHDRECQRCGRDRW